MQLSRLKRVPCIAWCLALGGLCLITWYAATPTFADAENSPHQVYRLEFHKASLLQRVAHPTQKMPYVVRLYRIEPKTLLGESAVVDLLFNGEVSWHLDAPLQFNKVYVGRDVLFENIPGECNEPARVPSCPNYKH